MHFFTVLVQGHTIITKLISCKCSCKGRILEPFKAVFYTNFYLLLRLSRMHSVYSERSMKYILKISFVSRLKETIEITLESYDINERHEYSPNLHHILHIFLLIMYKIIWKKWITSLWHSGFFFSCVPHVKL